MNIKNIGKNLKEIRRFLGMTIADLSNLTGLTSPAISQIENGKRIPELKSVVQLIEKLNISFERLCK
jgi:transcriptional regulator with XRE-family HTH domain